MDARGEMIYGRSVAPKIIAERDRPTGPVDHNRSDRRRRLRRRLAHVQERNGGSFDTAEASALRWILDAEQRLRRERDEGMRRGILYAAEAFESDAVRAPNGSAFHSGGLHGASIYNVNMRTARKLRELADAAPWEESTDD